MTVVSWIILALWLVLIAYWAVSAIGVKRSIGAGRLRREVGLRLGAIVLILLALHVPFVRNALRDARGDAVNTNMIRGVIGVALSVVGVGFAIWARAFLGRNWGMPMSRKEHPELVTTGPYALVRHPIYTGLILAMLGSAVAESNFWLIPFVLFGAYFVYSARSEEKLMMEQFPEQYPAYRTRTKMLIPFIV